MFSGVLGDRLGGRESLRILAACYVISALGCAFAWSWPSLLVFRFIGGLGIGGSSVLGPVYIAEIAPARWRGLLVGSFPDQYRDRHPGRVSIELPDRAGGFGINEWRWQLGVAAARRAVLCHAVWHSAQRPLAGHQEPHSRRPEVIEQLGSAGRAN